MKAELLSAILDLCAKNDHFGRLIYIVKTGMPGNVDGEMMKKCVDLWECLRQLISPVMT